MKLLYLCKLAALVSAINVKVSSHGGKKASPLMYGVMFEDINHSGDGGIYAELIQNRAFQSDPFTNATLDPWKAVGGAHISLATDKSPLSEALPNSIAVTGGKPGREVGISNPGYWGMDVVRQTYAGSFYVKGDYKGFFTASLRSNTTGKVFAKATIRSKSKAHSWAKHEYKIHSGKDHGPHAVFTLTYTPTRKTQSLNFNLISLFPPTWKNRPNGMRVDLMKTLAELKPSFLRFPGGNNLQGQVPGNQWRWNLTIGDLTERPGRTGGWQYFNTDGIGLIEYMEWCEDLNAEPIIGVWDGLWHDGSLVPEDELQPYVDDALDELEFLLGDASTTWGRKRAQLGYKKPFNIKYVEIGNEDNAKGGLPTYLAYRHWAFYDAIHTKYPHLEIIASTISLDRTESKSVLDYHQYVKPDRAADQFFYFEDVDPNIPYLVGEYASKTTNGMDSHNMARPWWIGSVGEAVFYLGTERNTDKVIGTAYAPTFQNDDSWLWGPDLITFNADTSKTVRSTSWYVLELLSTNRATKILPLSNSGDAAMYNPAFWVAGINEETDTYLWKGAVYNASSTVPFNVEFPGVGSGARAKLTVLTAPDGYSENVVGGENVVNTNITTLRASKEGGFQFSLPNLSVAVLSAPKGY